MGWIETHKPKGQSIRDFFQQEFVNSVDVLDCAVVNLSEVYLACRAKSAPHNVFAVVCLLRFIKDHHFNIMYKDMDEFAGPSVYNAPARILDLLSPTDNRTALDWRAECRKRSAQRRNIKLRKGDVILFEEPVKFISGSTCSKFRVLSTRPLRCSDADAKFSLTLYCFSKSRITTSPCKILRNNKVIYDTWAKDSQKAESTQLYLAMTA